MYSAEIGRIAIFHRKNGKNSKKISMILNISISIVQCLILYEYKLRKNKTGSNRKITNK